MISLYALSWMSMTVLSPLWLIGCTLVGLIRRRHFVLLRLFAFTWFFLGLELLILLYLGWLFFVRFRQDTEGLHASLFELQKWWASCLLGAAARLLKLEIRIDDVTAALPGPAIVVMRHASILDTLIPTVFVQAPHGWRVRYVLKQELMLDPCIDIVANTLPNYFVDRGGFRGRQLDRIRGLVRDLGNEGVLIYPEGTRFSPQKRELAVKRLRRQKPQLAAQGDEFTHVLPPRAGGVGALLDALPEVDCVFFAHAGLETFEKLNDVLSGAVVGSTVRGKLWRVNASSIPTSEAERERWLFSEWARVNAFIRDAHLTP
jgi:1-acyl-sn-glycerol-3-phosphate acyltransferase